MKISIFTLCVSGLLLFAIGFTQILHKVIMKEVACKVIRDCCEEPRGESSEENNHETEQDEDPLRVSEITDIVSKKSISHSSNENYFFEMPGNYYPEIVSPPPQG